MLSSLFSKRAVFVFYGHTWEHVAMKCPGIWDLLQKDLGLKGVEQETRQTRIWKYCSWVRGVHDNMLCFGLCLKFFLWQKPSASFIEVFALFNNVHWKHRCAHRISGKSEQIRVLLARLLITTSYFLFSKTPLILRHPIVWIAAFEFSWLEGQSWCGVWEKRRKDSHVKITHRGAPG